MTRPTAEEVLGLYAKWKATAKVLEDLRDNRSNEEQIHSAAINVVHDMKSFYAAYQQWQAAQGPVTREWFVERFGSDGVRTRTGLWLESIKNGDVLFDRDVINPSRSDIETLVRLLGGAE